MTPKEKAMEIAMKFDKQGETDNAKQCALICIDEIIKTKPMEKDYEDHGHLGREVWYNDNTEYWLNVKHELSLL